MNVSKTLSSAVAAATIVGAVGLAYAQSTSDPATRPADSTMNSNSSSSTTSSPATSPQSNTSNNNSSSSGTSQSTPSTSTTTTNSSDTTAAAPSSDLQPKADRN